MDDGDRHGRLDAVRRLPRVQEDGPGDRVVLGVPPLVACERLARLLRSTTGTSRVPVDALKDFQCSDGPRRFTIEKCGDPNGLPRSHTCFNRPDLPPYETMRAWSANSASQLSAFPLDFPLWEPLPLVRATTSVLVTTAPQSLFPCSLLPCVCLFTQARLCLLAYLFV